MKIIIFGLFVFLYSCSRSKPSRVPKDEKVEVETPEVLLKENSSESDLLTTRFSSYKNRGNLVEELFREACSKDIQLEELRKKIESEIEETNGLMIEFEDYKRLIDQVGLSIQEQAARVNNDSIMMKQIIDLYLENQNGFKTTVQPYFNKQTEIANKINQLENLLRKLKVLTALKMMQGYQDNEIPPFENFQDKDENLEELIELTKEAIQKKK